MKILIIKLLWALLFAIATALPACAQPADEPVPEARPAFPEGAEIGQDENGQWKLAEGQTLGELQWSVDQGDTWHLGSDRPNGQRAEPLPLVQRYSVVRFRVLKGNEKLPWPLRPDFLPKWKVIQAGHDKPEEFIGDEIGVHFPDMIRGNQLAATVTAECHNTFTTTVPGVSLGYEVRVETFAEYITAGAGDNGWRQFVAKVDTDDGDPKSKVKVRFNAVYADSKEAAGQFAVTTLTKDAVTGEEIRTAQFVDIGLSDENGYVRILFSADKPGDVLITAALLDANGEDVATSEPLKMPVVSLETAARLSAEAKAAYAKQRAEEEEAQQVRQAESDATARQNQTRKEEEREKGE